MLEISPVDDEGGQIRKEEECSATPFGLSICCEM